MPQGALLQLISDHRALVGVVGLGYVGLPFAVEKARVGFRVTGIDANPARVADVNAGNSYITDVSDESLADVVATGQLLATIDFDEVKGLDVIVVAVPTPLTVNLTPDLQYVEHVSREIASRLRPGQLVCLESTTYPGTTEEVMLPILETSGLRADEDFFLAHSPERVDPGNQRYTTRNTSKVVGGVGHRSLEVAAAFYSETIEHVVPVSAARSAEMVKVFENTFRAVNIALVNELAMLCDRMELDVWEILDAAFTKPFGIMPFYPGPGVGGHCIPIDPHYLEWKAREYNFNTHFIALAGEINRLMPEFVRDKTLRLLGRRRIPIAGAKVLALGLAYKRDLGDYRESSPLKVVELLRAEGADVRYHDPHVPEIQIEDQVLLSVDLSAEEVGAADVVLILTDHSVVDYEMVLTAAQRILDTRGVTRRMAAYDPDRVSLL